MNPRNPTSRTTLRRLSLGGLALVGVLGLAAAGFSQPPRGPGFGGGFGLHRILRTLDLSEEQEVLAVRLMRQVREERQALRADHEGRMAALKAQLAAETPDAARLHAMLDQMARERTQIGHAAIDRFLEFHATLSAEQRADIVSKLEKMEERRRRWHEN